MQERTTQFQFSIENARTMDPDEDKDVSKRKGKGKKEGPKKNTNELTYRRFLWLKESTCAVVKNGNRLQWGDELAFTLVIRDKGLVITDVDGPQANELGLRSGDVLEFITMAEKALSIAIATPGNEISEVAKGRRSTCKGKAAVVATGRYCKSEARLKVGDLLRKYKMRKRGAHTWFDKVITKKIFHLWYREEDDESNTKTTKAPDYFCRAVHHDEFPDLYAAWLKSPECKWMGPLGNIHLHSGDFSRAA
ncbi:hypothetical protein SDRG_01014 [Saprolegnia diclina VS20]|uniref:Uncharacterized protein n=1 Tax=Saprolegnia diclina (strain VS20) TaxID=1156394 RepID=T0R6U9_SAPDV|nr:hypothetical protein SDRG_01014 [Saprolegnia diclina VS20]EQC42175.1 hypothetical protein SDRG_01014 [Saprolegnia diclina VS20]|eukprot:XP_008604744.1 hypothetical protein SDRG_01014 [Saprolegnia diclina VS20]